LQKARRFSGIISIITKQKTFLLPSFLPSFLLFFFSSFLLSFFPSCFLSFFPSFLLAFFLIFLLCFLVKRRFMRCVWEIVGEIVGDVVVGGRGVGGLVF